MSKDLITKKDLELTQQSIDEKIKKANALIEELKKNNELNINNNTQNNINLDPKLKYKKGDFGYWWCIEKGKEDIEGKDYDDFISCSYCDLTSLKGCPKSVGGFDCSCNQLTSLEFAPESVGWDFDCSHNQLTSLEYLPKKVEGFICYGNNNISDEELIRVFGKSDKYEVGTFGYWRTMVNKREDIEGKDYNDSIFCSYCDLTSLKGAPKSVRGSFDCSCNQLTSLEFAPESVGWDFDCSHNHLTSLEYLPKKVKDFIHYGNNNISNEELIRVFGKSDKYEVGTFGYWWTMINKREDIEGEDYDDSIYCFSAGLTSLKGCPKSVYGCFDSGFDCSHNQLTSLEFAPESVISYFVCSDNVIKFTVEDVRKICDVSGGIYI